MKPYKSWFQPDMSKCSLLFPSAGVFQRSAPNLVCNEGLIEKDSLSTLQMILVKYCNVLGVKSLSFKERRYFLNTWETSWKVKKKSVQHYFTFLFNLRHLF